MNISENGLNLIKSFESCRLRAYKNAAGEWIIGYGWKRPINDVPIHDGMIITQAQADELLLKMLSRYETRVTELLTVVITQNQFDALVSLACSIGLKTLSTATLLEKLNAGDTQGTADEFLIWDKVAGRRASFEVRRRAVERELFLS